MVKSEQRHYFDVHEFERIATHYRQKGESEKALQAINYGLGMHPQSLQMKHLKAEILVEKGRIDEAFPILKTLLAIEPNNPNLRLVQGSALTLAGETVKAVKAFDHALNFLFGEEKAQTAYSVGMNLERHSHYQEAVLFLERAIELNSDLYIAHYDLGYCYEKLGDFEASIKHYKLHLKKFPFASDAWYNLNISYQSLLMYDEAVEALDYALAIKPNYASAIYSKAQVLCDLGQHQEAINMFKQYLTQDPENDETLVMLGFCYDTIKQTEKARENYIEALWFNPDNDEAHFYLAISYLDTEEVNDGLFHIKKALKLEPKAPHYHRVHGRLLLLNNQLEKAMKAFQLSIDNDPGESDAWLAISELMRDQGDLDLAIKVLQRALEYNYEKPEINFRLAAYLLDNEQEQGLQYLEEALQIDPQMIDEFTAWRDSSFMSEEVKEIMDEYLQGTSTTPAS